MQTLLVIFGSFFKIGLFTFGGGYAMIPLIEREVIDRRGWVERREFLDLLTLAQSVPGPIAVNTAVFVGYRMRGVRGALAALWGTILPSFTIILLIALFFADIRHNPVVDAAFKGMRPRGGGADHRSGRLAGAGHALADVRSDSRGGAGDLGAGLVARLRAGRSGRSGNRVGTGCGRKSRETTAAPCRKAGKCKF